MLHPGVDYSSREPVPAAPGTASSRVSSEYNRHNRKSRVPGVSKNATPPTAFGNDGGPPPGQPFRHTQVRTHIPEPLAAARPRPDQPACLLRVQSVIAETEPVHSWLPAIGSPRAGSSAQCVDPAIPSASCLAGHLCGNRCLSSPRVSTTPHALAQLTTHCAACQVVRGQERPDHSPPLLHPHAVGPQRGCVGSVCQGQPSGHTAARTGHGALTVEDDLHTARTGGALADLRAPDIPWRWRRWRIRRWQHRGHPGWPGLPSPSQLPARGERTPGWLGQAAATQNENVAARFV